MTDVFFIIGFNVSLFRNDFFGHVVYRQYDEGNVAFFGFDKIGAEVFIILFGFFRRNFAVNFNLCRVNDNVFKSLLLAFDFGQPVGQNFRNVHVDGRILNQLLLNNVLFQGVDIALLGPAGSGQNPAQAFQAEIAVGVQKFRLRINDFAHQIVADVHVQLVCRSLNDGVGKLALNQSLQHGVADFVVNLQIVAEQAAGHLLFLLEKRAELLLRYSDVVNLDNRLVSGRTRQISRNAEQRHKAQSRQNQNQFRHPVFLSFR